jgi:CpeT/CpcT family (DUF1001)
MPKQFSTQKRYTALLAVIAAAAVPLLSGCADQKKKKDEVPLMELQVRLPGRYDNAAQVRDDTRSGVVEPHAALDLLVAPAKADLVGKASYYVRETAHGDPRRVLSQRIWVFGHTTDAHSKDERIEQHIYLFKEPQRWVHVGEEPELLESLLPEDLVQLPGCELIWTKKDTAFIAHRKAENCSPAGRSEGLLLEQRMELRENQLALQEQQVGPDGLIDVSASLADPFYRFVRRGAAN